MSNRKSKTRNKQSPAHSVATAEGQDDEYFPLGDEVGTVASESHSSITSEGRGIPSNIKKQLFLDIEARGGLDNCDLSALCNAKEDIYGAPNTPFRKKIQNQRTRWKTSQKQDYIDLKLGVDPYANKGISSPPLVINTGPAHSPSPRRRLKTQLPRRSKSSPPQRLPEISETSPEHQSPPTRHRRSFSANSPKFIRRFSPDPPRFTMSSNSSNSTNPFIARLLSDVDYHEIEVKLSGEHTTAPWFGPFYIYYFSDHTHNSKTLHNAVHIEIKDQDLRFMVGDHEETMFEAWHVGGSRVMVKKPISSFAFLKEKKEEEDAKATCGYSNPRSLEANNVTRNNIINTAASHFEYYLLNFKEFQLGLDNDIFSAKAENGKIESFVAVTQGKLTISTAGGHKEIASYRANIIWDIAIMERSPRYVTDAQPRKNELDAKVTSAFDRMNLSSIVVVSGAPVKPMLSGASSAASANKKRRTIASTETKAASAPTASPAPAALPAPASTSNALTLPTSTDVAPSVTSGTARPKSFWDGAFGLAGTVSGVVLGTQKTIDSSPNDTDDMDAERSKESRRGENLDDQSSSKKPKAIVRATNVHQSTTEANTERIAFQEPQDLKAASWTYRENDDDEDSL